jgi:hypothetical protein
MTTRQDLLKKWQPILEAAGAPEIKENHAGNLHDGS